SLLPLPRPIALKEAAIAVIKRRVPQVIYTPEMVDIEGQRFVHARPPSDSVRRMHDVAIPALVLLPKYSAGAKTALERVAKAQALMELTRQSFNFNYIIGGFDALVRIVRQSDCYSVEYSDLDDLLPRLEDLVGA